MGPDPFRAALPGAVRDDGRHVCCNVARTYEPFEEIVRLRVAMTASHIRPFVLEVLGERGPMRRDQLLAELKDAYARAGGAPVEDAKQLTRLKKALCALKNDGEVANPGYGVWMIADMEADEIEKLVDRVEQASEDDDDVGEVAAFAAQRSFGVGAQCVYAFYLPAYRALAEQRGERWWPMKIGKTTGDLAVRMAALSTSMPETPCVALALRTDDANLLERALHAALKLRGRHLSEAGGSEWFRCSPDEVLDVYRFLVAV